ncbi:MAG: hypothetical protein HOP30_10970 [Cyclobacteriaceae bacterium]|nr:hypothetical protein [Cyclobacteriaceae bacterium]
MMKIVTILLLVSSSLITHAQTKFSTKGISVVLPAGFETTNTHNSEFASFIKDERVLISFADACSEILKKKKFPENQFTIDVCYRIFFIKWKAIYDPTWVKEPQDTVLKKSKAKWGEFHAKIKDKEYYFICILIKGKKHNYQILSTGHLEHKKADVELLKSVIQSYKEVK